MNIYKPGQKCLINKDILAKIISVCIYENRVAYYIEWWDGRSITRDYFAEKDINFSVGKGTKISIGFKNES